MIHKSQLFLKMSLRRKLLLLSAFALSLYSWIMMRFFKKRAIFGQRDKPIEIKNINNALIADIRFAIRIAHKYVPYENACRHQAYQAMLLCRYYAIPYQIYVGFQKNEAGKIVGHAWTVVQGEMITGFCNPDDYIVQAVYA